MSALERFTDIFNSVPYLLVGVLTTLEITVITLVFGFVLGIPVALLRVYGNTFLAGTALAISHLLRTVPVILIIFIFYFVIARLFNLSALVSVCLALGIRSAAYQSEIFRGALQSISSGQLIAARAQGLSMFQGIYYVILPQAIKLSLSGWTNEAAIVLKDSSFAFAVGVPELFRRATYLGTRTFEPLAAYLACALIYLALTYLITLSTKYFDNTKYQRGEVID